jgi:hypothetical protein
MIVHRNLRYFSSGAEVGESLHSRDRWFCYVVYNSRKFNGFNNCRISNTFYTVGFYTVGFYTVKIYTIIFYTVIFYTVAKFIRSFFIWSKFILVKIYTGQNLYRSKFIQSKFILCIVEAYSHCAHCQVVLWRSHVIFEQL